MKFRHSLVACGIFFLAVLSCHGSSVIFQNGKTDYRIYVAPDATPAEKNAAAEFQKYWKLATGTGIAVSGKYTGNGRFSSVFRRKHRSCFPEST